MSEIRAALAALAAADPDLKRFGAAHHRYQLAPPGHRSPHDLPADLVELVTTIGASGAGPGYGFLGVDRGVVEAARPWKKGVVVAHLGCGYAAIVALDGQVWIDAPAIGVVEPIAPSFTAWYRAWLASTSGSGTGSTPPTAGDRSASGAKRQIVPPNVCPLPNAISGFLAIHEQRLGIDAGTLSGPALREALAELGPHAIEIAATHSLLFANGTRVDPCETCAALIEKLGEDGLRPDVVRPA